MSAVLNQLCVLYMFLGLGWFFGKRKGELIQQTGLLSFLLVNLCLPCKVFQTFSSNFTPDFLTNNKETILVSVSLLLVLVGLAIPLTRLISKDDYEQKVYRYSVPISNYAYLGYVLIEELFGTDSLTNMILFCIPFSMYTYSFGYAMLTGKGNFWKKMINPMTCALALGIVFGLTGIQLPSLFNKVISSASVCMGPMGMLLTGLTLAGFSFKKLISNKTAYLFTVIRLVILPLLIYVSFRLLHLDSTLPYAVTIACMPTGLNTIIFPKLVGEDCSIGARIAFISHLSSCLTIPIWLSLLYSA